MNVRSIDRIIPLALLASVLGACGSPPPPVQPSPSLEAAEPAAPPLDLDVDAPVSPAVRVIDEQARKAWQVAYVPLDTPLESPEGLDLSNDGTLAIAEPAAYRIRVRRPDGSWRWLGAGGPGRVDGPSGESRWMGPRAIRWAGSGRWLVADFDHLRWVTSEGRTETWNLRWPDGRPYLPVEILGLTPLSQGAWAVSTPTGLDRVDVGGVVRHLAGQDLVGFQDGAGALARFHLPRQLATLEGDRVLVPDQGNLRLREVYPDGRVVTWAGTGLPGLVDAPRDRARFGHPLAVDRGPDGAVAVADTYNRAIRLVTPDGLVQTLFEDGLPTQVRWDPAGRIWFLEGRSGRLGWLQLSGEVQS